MKKNTHNLQNGRHVVISEDAQSQIRYLETHFKRDRWEATVLLCGDEVSEANNIQHDLQAKGYAPQSHRNENGDVEIRFTHKGAHDGLVQAVQDAGLMRGSLHFLKHTPTHLADLVDGTEHFVKYATGDTARLMSGLYLVGDVLQMGNGFGGTPMPGESRAHAFLRPENSLNSLSFAMSTVQSLLLLHYAKESHELLRDNLEQARDKAIEEGRDPLDMSQWVDAAAHKNSEGGIFSRFDGWAKENPITMGATSMISACAVFAVANLFQFKRANRSLKGLAEYPLGVAKAEEMRKGALSNLGFSVGSSLGWLYFMSDKKEHAEHAPWYEGNQIVNPAQLFRETQKLPNQTGSVLVAGGSAFGLKGAIESKNMVQALGQCVYLTGDAMMFLTEKKEYGKESAGDTSEMAKAAAQFISRGPIVLGQDACEHYVQQLAEYVVGKQEIDTSEAKTAIKALKGEIINELGSCYHPLIDIAEKAVPLLQAYPREQRALAREGLLEGLMAMPNMFVSERELSHALNYATASQDKKAKVRTFAPSASGPTPERYTEILIHAIPGQCDAANALILRDAMSKKLGFKTESENDVAPPPVNQLTEVSIHSPLKGPLSVSHAAL